MLSVQEVQALEIGRVPTRIHRVQLFILSLNSRQMQFQAMLKVSFIAGQLVLTGLMIIHGHGELVWVLTHISDTLANISM